MSYYKTLEDDLRTLSVDSKKKNKAIKEASETGLQVLRDLESKAKNGEVKRDIMIFQPFMMALAKTTEKTNIILDALNGIQHLVSFNAVNEDDMDSISQAFLAQANSESFDVVLKILQIFSILMNPSFDIRCDTMSRLFTALFKFHLEYTDGLIVNTSLATIHQVITVLLDRVESKVVGKTAAKEVFEEQDKITDRRPQSEPPKSLTGYSQSLFMLVQDLCEACYNREGLWIKEIQIPPALGIEFIRFILYKHDNIFKSRPEFVRLLKHHVITTVSMNMDSAVEFSHQFGYMKALSCLLTDYYNMIGDECEIFLEMIPRNIIREDIIFPVQWSTILSLEVLRAVTSKCDLLISTYKKYDCSDKSSNVYQTLIESISQFIKNGYSQIRKTDRLDAAWDFHWKRPTLKDELEEEPELYTTQQVLMIGLEAIGNIAEALDMLQQKYQSVKNKKKSDEELESKPSENDFPLTQEEFSKLTLLSWKYIYDTLNLYMTHSYEDSLVGYLCGLYQSVTFTCGYLELEQPKTEYLISLCYYAVPKRGIQDISQLSCRNIQSIKTVVNIATNLSPIMGQSWSIVLQTLDSFYELYEKRGSTQTDMNNPFSNDAEIQILENSINTLFEQSKYITDQALVLMIRALGVLSVKDLGDSVEDTTKARDRLASSVNIGIKIDKDEAKTRISNPPFVLRQFFNTIKINIYRISLIWDTFVRYETCFTSNKLEKIRTFSVKEYFAMIIALLNYTKPDNKSDSSNKTPEYTGKYKPPSSMQAKALEPLSRFLSHGHDDLNKLVLEQIEELLNVCGGDALKDGWQYIIQSLENAAKNCPDNDEIVTLGFRNVQLIGDDFLYEMTNGSLEYYITCIAAYARQTADINHSLTSIGIYWKVGDYIRRYVEKSTGGPPDVDFIDQMRKNLMTELCSLGFDSRPQVRNCAIETLCGILVTHGKILVNNKWEECIKGSLFPFMKDIKRNSQEHKGQTAESSDPKIRVHHSRDTLEKQWNETIVLTLRGVVRIIKQYIIILNQFDWFDGVWNDLLSQIKQYANQSSGKEVPLAALNCFYEMHPLISDTSTGKKYSTGMKVVDGALVQVASTSESSSASDTPRDGIAEDKRIQLWIDVLKCYEDICANTNLIKHTDFYDIVSQIIKNLKNFHESSREKEFSDPQYLRRLFNCFVSLLEMSVKVPDPNNGTPRKNAKPTMNQVQRQVLEYLEKIVLPPKTEIWTLYIEILQKILFSANNILFENKIKTILITTYQNCPIEAKALSFETMIKSLTRLMEIRKGRGDGSTEESEWNTIIETINSVITNGLRAAVTESERVTDELVKNSWKMVCEVIKTSSVPPVSANDLQLLKTTVSSIVPLIPDDLVPVDAQDLITTTIFNCASTSIGADSTISNEEMAKLSISLLMDFCEDKGDSLPALSMAKKALPHLLRLLEQLLEIITGKVNIEFADPKLSEADRLDYLPHYGPKSVLREQHNVIIHSLTRLISLKVNNSVLPDCPIQSKVEGKIPGLIWRLFPRLCISINTKDEDIRKLIQRLMVKASQEIGLY